MYVRWQDKDKVFENTKLVDEKLTAIIKTFERPGTIERLIKSIKHFYPKMNVIIADDSKKTIQLDGVTVITMPYDSGVSAGRNRALSEVKTEYVLLLDDDFIFYYKTDFDEALKLMEENLKIDIMGGEVVNLPSFKANDYRNANLHPTDAKATTPQGNYIARMPVYDKVPNFYIARTDRLRLVGWDNRLKRLDHADFFTRAKGILTTVFNKNFKILHAQTPFNKSYMKKRNDVENDRIILHQKYYRLKEGK